MSTDNQPGKGSQLQKEWEEQGWDYLVLACYKEFPQQFIGKIEDESRRTYSPDKDKDIDPVVAHYNQKLSEIGKYRIVTEALKIAGDDGWELVSSFKNFPQGTAEQYNFLIFKRPKK